MFDWSSYQAHQLRYPQAPTIEDFVVATLATQPCMQRCDLVDRVSGDLLIDRKEVEENLSNVLTKLEEQGKVRHCIHRGWWKVA